MLRRRLPIFSPKAAASATRNSVRAVSVVKDTLVESLVWTSSSRLVSALGLKSSRSSESNISNNSILGDEMSDVHSFTSLDRVILKQMAEDIVAACQSGSSSDLQKKVDMFQSRSAEILQLLRTQAQADAEDVASTSSAAEAGGELLRADGASTAPTALPAAPGLEEVPATPTLHEATLETAPKTESTRKRVADVKSLAEQPMGMLKSLAEQPMGMLKSGRGAPAAMLKRADSSPVLTRAASVKQVVDPGVQELAKMHGGASEAKQYCPRTSGVTGYLIDLDGTMYEPGNLIPGARAFYRWLLDTGAPHVFLSNTGSKNSHGVQQKFLQEPYLLHEKPVPLANIHTAAEAQSDYLLDHVPPHARLLVISGGRGVWQQELRQRRGERGAALVDTWELRTQLSEREAKDWAACSACSSTDGKPLVWVVFFHDGGLEGMRDEHSGKAGFTDWGMEVIKTTGFLLSHGAQFVYSADDAYNPSFDPDYPGLIFPLPGPGMFAEMMKKLMFPRASHAVFCAGKGGNVGRKYMMETAIEMLKQQGHSGERSSILMVGDRFDTDVRAGLQVGIKTCLVVTGCHTLSDQKSYRTDPVTYWASSIDMLCLLAEGESRRMRFPSTEAALLDGSEAFGLSGEKASAEALLQEWVLTQSDKLRPGVAELKRQELRPRLAAYYKYAAEIGGGLMRQHELMRACEMMGLDGALAMDEGASSLPLNSSGEQVDVDPTTAKLMRRRKLAAEKGDAVADTGEDLNLLTLDAPRSPAHSPAELGGSAPRQSSPSVSPPHARASQETSAANTELSHGEGMGGGVGGGGWGGVGWGGGGSHF